MRQRIGVIAEHKVSIPVSAYSATQSIHRNIIPANHYYYAQPVLLSIDTISVSLSLHSIRGIIRRSNPTPPPCTALHKVIPSLPPYALYGRYPGVETSSMDPCYSSAHLTSLNGFSFLSRSRLPFSSALHAQYSPSLISAYDA